MDIKAWAMLALLLVVLLLMGAPLIKGAFLCLFFGLWWELGREREYEKHLE